MRTTVLGTMKPQSRRYIGRTVVAIEFSQGTTWREYFWTSEGTVGDVGPIERPPITQVFRDAYALRVVGQPVSLRRESTHRLLLRAPPNQRLQQTTP